MSVQVITSATGGAAAEACGAAILDSMRVAREARGSAKVAVSGGSTPRIMFEWMARQAFDWRDIDLYWVDERCVPADDPESNYRMTREALLDAIQLDPGRIHRVQTEFAPDEAAALYAADIRSSFGLVEGELPVFDVLQRGMGPDTHTASLFPGEPMIGNHTSIAAALWVEKFRQHRVTLLPGVLERSRLTVCLVTGADKAEGLARVLRGPVNRLETPAQISSPEMIWYIDKVAAAGLAG
ncbi:MAG: 6-phosphogluconolactonase [Terriglobia bacterium]